MGDKFFLRRFVKNLLGLTGSRGVLGQVVIAAGGDPPKLLHPEGIFKHDIHRAPRIER